MSNALQLDPKTGFLESPSPSQSTFTAEKKIRFLELAMTERQAGRFPNLSDLCDVVGVNMWTVDRHLVQDEAFKQAWHEIVLRVESQAMADMWENRLKQPLFMFGLMRRLLPQRWNPDSKHTVEVNIQQAPALLDRAGALEAEFSNAREGAPTLASEITHPLPSDSVTTPPQDTQTKKATS